MSLAPPMKNPVDMPNQSNKYWRADGLAAAAREAFEAARTSGNQPAMRNAFFRVTHFYAKTIGIWQEALKKKREPLAMVALSNLIQLDAVVGTMHQSAPEVVPLAQPLAKAIRDHFLRGLVVRLLDETPLPLNLIQIVQQLNEYELLGQLKPNKVEEQLQLLLNAGYISQSKSGFKRTTKVYDELQSDSAILEHLLGSEVAQAVFASGFNGIIDVIQRQDEFVEVFVAATGMSSPVGTLFVAVTAAFANEQEAGHTPWRHLDLLGSRIPRPYQRTAFAILKGTGYRGNLLEATTGSGKTMIGLMCIQDFLRRIESGQSVLVLVPTNNYQQQWVRELCFHHGALQLAPEVVFAGTIADLKRYQKRSGKTPAVFVLTYASLAQLDTIQTKQDATDSQSSELVVDSAPRDELQNFIDTFGVEYVVLDEAHKVVDDLESVSANVVRLLTNKLAKGKISGLIGFSGTLNVSKRRFESVGLRLVHRVPLLEMLGTGFVAPFAEFGVPYALSKREQTVGELLDAFRLMFREFLSLCDKELVRAEFLKIDFEQRKQMASRFLGMYSSRADSEELLNHRIKEWEQFETLGLGNAPIVLMVQTANGLSEFGLVPRSQWPQLKSLIEQATKQRDKSADLCALDDVSQVLHEKEKLGVKPDSNEVMRLLRPNLSPTIVRRRFREMTRSTLTGVFVGVRQWGRHLGEGRIAAVKAIIAAEKQARNVTGTIVFDDSRSIRWGNVAASAGFEGVGGMFGQLLGEPDMVPIAALSKEIYLPVDDNNPFAPRIAAFIHDTILLGEFRAAISDLILSGQDIAADVVEQFDESLFRLLSDWLSEASRDHLSKEHDQIDGSELSAKATDSASHWQSLDRPTWKEFFDSVIAELRDEFGHIQDGIPKRAAARFRLRLHRRNVNLKSLMTGFFDYMQIADQYVNCQRCELKQADGSLQSFRVIPIPNGRRRQLMYDLVARMVDDVDLPFNVVIVSDWARSGWNVIKPNLLIDATATRDVIAWQQLRGRAMRSQRTWNIDCYRLLAALRSDPVNTDDKETTLPELPLADAQIKMLAGVMKPAVLKLARSGGLDALTMEQRLAAAVKLVQNHNKVTHIYELLDATGRSPQLVLNAETLKWQRRDSVAQKHQGQLNVDIATKSLVTESVDSMLICPADPRIETSANLESAVLKKITDCDPVIVETWLKPGFSIDKP